MLTRRRRPHPLEHLRDLFVYAPIGFLSEAPRLVPEMVEAGRRRLAAAGSVGRLVLGLGQPRVTPLATRPGEADHAVDVEDEPGHEITVEVIGEASGGTGRRRAAPLPIPGYDQLAASQVVARLEGLAGRDLDAVEAYEQAHRGRRTVLAKITQLRKA